MRREVAKAFTRFAVAGAQLIEVADHSRALPRAKVADALNECIDRLVKLIAQAHARRERALARAVGEPRERRAA